MVNFAQGFLQNLANPAMSKSLFGAGAAIGNLPKQYQQQQEMQKLSSATPVERFDMAIAKATKAGKLGEAARLTASRDRYVAEQNAQSVDQITSLVASTMVSNGDTKVPTEITFNGEQLSIDPKLSSEILKEVNSIQTNKDARETAMLEGRISENTANYLKNNPYLLEQNPLLAKDLEKLNKPDSGLLRVQRINIANALTKAVEVDMAEKKKATTGEKALSVRVSNLIDKIRAGKDNTINFWQGASMVDFVNSAEDEEIELFREQAVLKLQQNPNATDTEIIDYAMAGMRNKIPGEAQNRAINEQYKKTQIREEANIKGIMEAKSVSREEAEEILQQIRMGLTKQDFMNSYTPPPKD